MDARAMLRVPLSLSCSNLYANRSNFSVQETHVAHPISGDQAGLPP